MEKKKETRGRPRKEPTYNFSIQMSKSMKEFLSKPDNKGKINKLIKGLNDIYSEHAKRCENLEDELNRLWVARCKANDAFVDFIALLKQKGYSFKFSDLPTKQLELVKIEE